MCYVLQTLGGRTTGSSQLLQAVLLQTVVEVGWEHISGAGVFKSCVHEIARVTACELCCDVLFALLLLLLLLLLPQV
jgi:hypothetical protein